MIQEFQNWLSYERRVSPHTVTSYINDLNKFTLFLNSNYPDDSLLSVRTVQIKSWLVMLMDQGYAATSLSRKIVTLNMFYTFLIREGKMDENPAARVKAPKKPKRLVKYLEEKDIIGVLDNFEYADNFYGIRDKLIIEMLYGTGIRLSELIGLKDVDTTAGVIKVLGKRSKERLIPINKSLCDLIIKYRTLRNEVFGSINEDCLILTDKGKKIYPMMVSRIVKKYLDVYAVKTKVSPHVLRHSFATHLLNRGADINAIKELLGHANLAATQIYTHNTIERLKKVHKQAHPRG